MLVIRAVTKFFPQLASRAGKMEKLPARIETYQPKHYITVTALQILTRQSGEKTTRPTQNLPAAGVRAGAIYRPA